MKSIPDKDAVVTWVTHQVAKANAATCTVAANASEMWALLAIHLGNATAVTAAEVELSVTIGTKRWTYRVRAGTDCLTTGPLIWDFSKAPLYNHAGTLNQALVVTVAADANAGWDLNIAYK